jgi:hypothetical protein
MKRLTVLATNVMLTPALCVLAGCGIVSSAAPSPQRSDTGNSPTPRVSVSAANSSLDRCALLTYSEVSSAISAHAAGVSAFTNEWL